MNWRFLSGTAPSSQAGRAVLGALRACWEKRSSLGAALWLALKEWASREKMKAEDGHRTRGTSEREQWSLKRNQGKQE